MTDEAGFLAALAEHPECETTRLVYADWLDEHERPEEAARQRRMAPGWRALVLHKMAPRLDGGDKEPVRTWFGRKYSSRDYDPDQDWLELIADRAPQEDFSRSVTADDCPSCRRSEQGDALWVNFADSQRAMDAAALAFADLPAARQAELLAVPLEIAEEVGTTPVAPGADGR